MNKYLLVIALLLHVPLAAGGSETGTVHLLRNATIHTVDEDLPMASAMAWDGNGRILALGSDSDLLKRFPEAEVRDLGGGVVVPGLIDAHAHLEGLALLLTQADLSGTGSVAEILDRLREQEARLGPGNWLLGRGWDQNDWDVQRLPTRRDLDAAFPDRPVWLRRIDGHAGWANSAALALTDRDLSGTWQPPAGLIHRDAAGQATGVLVDGAMGLVEALVPPPSAGVMESLVPEAIAIMTRFGLTGVHDAGVAPEMIELYRRLVEQGRFDTRVYAMAGGAGAALEWLCARGAIRHPSGRLVVQSVKLYADGALGSRGAALLDDYSDDPGNRGLLFQQPDVLLSEVEKVMRCGFQVAVHAIGDLANRAVLDAYERAIPLFPDNPGRHRIEHAQILTAADLPRFSQLHVIAAMQPTHATSDMYWAEQRLGPERLRLSYAWRSLLDSGARLALGSDFPVEKVNPMLGIHAAITRQDTAGWPDGGWRPEERMRRDEALRGFTLDAAYAGFMEEEVGSLAVGKRADFVLLDRDILSVPAGQIPGTVVLETWLDGRRVYPGPAPSHD